MLEPAIRLADRGFVTSPYLASQFRASCDRLAQFKSTRRQWLPGGEPPAPGTLIRQPDLAGTLRTIAAQGRDGFYRGPIAKRVVAYLRQAGGILEEDDFAEYSAREGTPLHAGYLSALMSAGWTIGAVGGSSRTAGSVRALMTAGPLLMASALIGMFVLMPQSAGHDTTRLWLIGACLLTQGLGIGSAWPHLCAKVFAVAPETEKDLAATSITIVIMVANALGSSLGGMVTNLAGLTNPGGVLGAASAATWYFGVYAFAPLLAFLAVRRVLSARLSVVRIR